MSNGSLSVIKTSKRNETTQLSLHKNSRKYCLQIRDSKLQHYHNFNKQQFLLSAMTTFLGHY